MSETLSGGKHPTASGIFPIFLEDRREYSFYWRTSTTRRKR
jgi:hypothetical protein